MFRLVKWVCDELEIPMMMQTTDDYVTPRFSLDPFFWLHHVSIKEWYRWAVQKASYIVTIGDLMAEEYKQRFGGNYVVAMNSIAIEDIKDYSYKGEKVKLVYAGNLGLNRWKVLSIIGQCLHELSNEGLKGELSIYSIVEPEGNVAKALYLPPFMSFKGKLDQAQLRQVKEESDILVHVEAFDKTNRYITRLSISTKIPEYMQSGRCILAVGPCDVASIRYLKDNDMAMTITDSNYDQIKESLRYIMLDEQKRKQYAKKARDLAIERHSINTIKDMIYEIMVDATSK
jgi:glycosyltransferase involved in cell wall biosynthesis